MPIQKDFSGLTYSQAEMELNKVKNKEEWRNTLKSKESKFPILFKCGYQSVQFLSYSKEEMKYLCDYLKIKSVISCSVVIFKKKWYKKQETSKILGSLLHISDLDLPDEEDEYDESIHSSLLSYRIEVLKQVFNISRYPKLYEELKKKK